MEVEKDPVRDLQLHQVLHVNGGDGDNSYFINSLLQTWGALQDQTLSCQYGRSIDETCRQLNRKPPILQVFLNDLPRNDSQLHLQGNLESTGAENSTEQREHLPGKDKPSWCPQSILESGLIEESMLDSFNIPFYGALAEEVRDVIQAEGSFTI
ncbi:hypothetical protein POTOM_062134 [Populus tomentosa]|uniref:Uncharacterized protein n=1 Tax=Populus tomentosa TaxID=118781 RepID=A0A8X8BZS5_POPTO|nr:hypothetical protein POTOM_062134 [Populus tomentosa]